MKILFVIHQISYADHVSIGYLSAIAKQFGHSTFLCILEDRDLLEVIDEIKPDVVAYSVNIVGYQEIIAAHKRAREKYEFTSIMGGPQATFSPETFQESQMDAYCVGEGEYAFRDFLIRLQNGDSFDDVENLITRKGENPVRALIRNLDELPLPDRDLVISNCFLKDVPKKTFYATRDCPFQCAYCCNNYYRQLYRGKGPIVRRFSVERIIQEIESIKDKYRMDFVKFGDDLFAIKADEWLQEFAEKYSQRISIPFNCFLRMDRIDDNLLSLLKKAGCFSVHLSLDSVSETVREKVLSRKMKKIDIEGNLKKIREHGINTWVNYMLAVPESTLQDDLATIMVSKKGKVTYPNYSMTVPMKGTDLYDYCIEHDLIDQSTFVSDMNGCSERSELLCFSAKEKDIRFNIYLLGAMIAKLPYPLDRLAIWLIKVVPPNMFFRKIRDVIYNYYITHKIFKLPKIGYGDI